MGSPLLVYYFVFFLTLGKKGKDLMVRQLYKDSIEEERNFVLSKPLWAELALD